LDNITRKLDAYTLIARERERQKSIYGPDNGNVLAQNWGMGLAVLMEEVGEVAMSLQDDGVVDPEELVQVAAVCVAWLEGLGYDFTGE
jgi:hypothetical protein